MAANAFLQNGCNCHEHLLSLFLIQGRTHCLRFLLLYLLESVTNPLQQLVTIPSIFVTYVRHF